MKNELTMEKGNSAKRRKIRNKDWIHKAVAHIMQHLFVYVLLVKDTFSLAD